MSDPVRINRAEWLATLGSLGLDLEDVVDVAITDSVRGGRITVRRLRRGPDDMIVEGAYVTTEIGIQSAAEMIGIRDGSQPS